MIVELNNSAWTAQHVIKKLVLEADDVDSIAVVMIMKDKSMSTVTSQMPLSTLALLSKRLDIRVMDALYEAKVKE